MKTMPNNNTPDIWKVIWDGVMYFSINHRELLIAIFVNIFVVFARMMSDKKKDTFPRMAAEAFLCSSIVGAIYPILDNFNWDIEYIHLVSIFIGYMGTGYIRKMIITFVKKWTGLKDEN